MKKIYSKIQPQKLLHIFYTIEDFQGRDNICKDEDCLQVASMKLESDRVFPAHIHLPQERHTTLTQEAWVVVWGIIEVSYYDLNGTFLQSEVLTKGSCSITLEGGHTYKSLSSAWIYEFKTGPYNGVKKDKKLIQEDQKNQKKPKEPRE